MEGWARGRRRGFEIDLDSGCADVFALLTELSQLRRWMPVTVFEPWVGGRFELEARGMVAVGSILRMEPPHLLIYSWDWRDSPLTAPSEVTITLRPRDEGTRLHLRHGGLSAAQRVEFAEGWAYYLPRLQNSADGRGTGPDRFAAGAG